MLYSRGVVGFCATRQSKERKEKKQSSTAREWAGSGVFKITFGFLGFCRRRCYGSLPASSRGGSLAFPPSLLLLLSLHTRQNFSPVPPTKISHKSSITHRRRPPCGSPPVSSPPRATPPAARCCACCPRGSWGRRPRPPPVIPPCCARAAGRPPPPGARPRGPSWRSRTSGC